MQNKLFSAPSHLGVGGVAIMFVMSGLMCGCALSPMAKHTAAFSTATNEVVDSSKDAYRAANRLRQEEQVSAAVYAYDKNPAWNPENDAKPLLTVDQLNARITVLDGLKAYAASLVEITGAKSSKDRDKAAGGVGSNLKSLSSTASTSLANASASAMSASESNGVSTAVHALADYLSREKEKGSLARVTLEMNPVIKTLCDLLDSDLVTLRRQADVDYEALLQDEDQFIRHPSSPLSPVEHRTEVGKLITLAAQKKANDELLSKLQIALHTLETTHQALTDAAQGQDHESIRQKIADLQAAGENLASFYNSLPSS